MLFDTVCDGSLALFVSSRVTGVPFERIAKGIIPFLPALYVVIVVCIFIPDLVLWLPRLMGMSV